MQRNITTILSRCLSRSSAGIIGMECYFPNQYISQSELEVYDEVGEGKYTIGLGQSELSYVEDLEDPASMMMTCVEQLLTKYDIDQNDIGALFVGTESAIDRSKSIKSHIMQIFDTENFESNTCIEGIDNINACYGGTQSLFDAYYWLEAHSEDEDAAPYAVAVCGDISEYSDPLARPTSGAGCVAMLLGREGTIRINPKKKQFHFDHAYDFYKPDPTSPYPICHGAYSNFCYLESLDRCYTKGEFKEEDYDYMLFHSPYNKLVQKSVGYVKFLDYLNENRLEEIPFLDEVEGLREEIIGIERTDSAKSCSIQNTFRKYFSDIYEEKTDPAVQLNKDIGNTYTASLYFSLCGLINEKGEDLENSKIMMYSYGSGLASAMFELEVFEAENEDFSVEKMKENLNIEEKLETRKKFEVESYIEAYQTREEIFTQMRNYETTGDVNSLRDGTYYLEGVDEHFRRVYKKKEPVSELISTERENKSENRDFL